MKNTRLTRDIQLNSSPTSSKIYQESSAELAEVLKHKWLESEKAGHDIGLERARVDWIMHHRLNWRVHRIRQQSSL
ncbi:MAG: DUF4032 domain-containing protein [Verrucomicrobiaceae bacterium]|nr:DUF4032 domain-containing protein [Verrucomicrobiaceae bacterium]